MTASLILIAVSVALTFMVVAPTPSLLSAALVACGVAFFSLWIAAWLGQWEFTALFAYVVVYVVFGLGLAPLVLWAEVSGAGIADPMFDGPLNWTRYFEALLPSAFLVSSAFCLSLVVPALVFTLRAGATAPSSAAVRKTSRRARDTAWASMGALRSSVAWVGCISVSVGAFGWLATVVAALGPGFFAVSYGEFLVATAQTALYNFYALMLLGMALAAIGYRSRPQLIAVCVFACFAVPAFPLGLRNEVLVPVLGYLVVRSRIAPVRMRGIHVLGAVLLLGVLDFVRSVRIVGLGAFESGVSFSPQGALAEMGASIRPVVQVILWHAVNSESSVGWQVYWAPFDRLISLVIGVSRPPAELDPRLFNVVMGNRVGPIGGLASAEAYYAGGFAAVLAVGLLVGLLLTVVDRARLGPIAMAFAGTFVAILLWNLRNSFAPTAGLVATSFALIVAAWSVAILQEAMGHATLKRLPGKSLEVLSGDARRYS